MKRCNQCDDLRKENKVLIKTINNLNSKKPIRIIKKIKSKSYVDGLKEGYNRGIKISFNELKALDFDSVQWEINLIKRGILSNGK